MTYLYVISADGVPVKIGISDNPKSRLIQLRTGTSFKLNLVFEKQISYPLSKRAEGLAHKALGMYRTHGEWFSVSVENAQEAVSRAIDEVGCALPTCEHWQSSSLLPVQLKMASAALGLTIHQVASLTGVSHDTIVRIEAGATLKPTTIDKVRSALEAAGIGFIPEDDKCGPGVHLVKPGERHAT